MDTDASANTNKEECSSQPSVVKKLKGSYESPGGDHPLGPDTPDPIRESGDPIDKLSFLRTQQFDEGVYSNEASPQTPKGLVFDPFAPGPDELMLAPQCKKYWQIKVMRRLHFEESLKFDDMVSVSEDEMLFESLYNSLLQVITSNQTEGTGTPLSDSDGYKTPTNQFSGVADTCPPAPMKPANQFRNIDRGSCKKLIF